MEDGSGTTPLLAMGEALVPAAARRGAMGLDAELPAWTGVAPEEQASVARS